MSAVLAVDGVEVSYGDVAILRDVAFELAAGEMTVLLGPNGSGKTTLLRALAGHLPIRAGGIELFGRPPRRAAYARARDGLAFIADDRQLFPNITVRQSLKLVGDNGDGIAATFPKVTELLDRRVDLLSGGEQQMLALGRTLIREPKLLMVDELSQGLAPKIREDLLGMLRKVADEGCAVLVVEQSVESALRVADRAIVLRRGSVIDDRPAAGWQDRQDELATLFLS